jgi:hypothetical protein
MRNLGVIGMHREHRAQESEHVIRLVERLTAAVCVTEDCR